MSLCFASHACILFFKPPTPSAAINKVLPAPVSYPCQSILEEIDRHISIATKLLNEAG